MGGLHEECEASWEERGGNLHPFVLRFKPVCCIQSSSAEARCQTGQRAFRRRSSEKNKEEGSRCVAWTQHPGLEVRMSAGANVRV